jgi:hypothetical protein
MPEFFVLFSANRLFFWSVKMVAAGQKESSPAPSAEAAADMAKYGIIRISVDYFLCGEYRYTNLKDAVAQAKRQKNPS